MITKSGKHHWQFGFTTYRESDGSVIWNADKTITITKDIKAWLDKKKEDYHRHGVRYEYRNLVDLDG